MPLRADLSLALEYPAHGVKYIRDKASFLFLNLTYED